MKNGRSSGSGRIGISKCGGEYLNRYLCQLINSCLERDTKAVERILWHHYIKKEVGKIPEIIGESVSIVCLVDCLPRLSLINYRKP
jgi:hypothetical protein